MKTRHHRGAPAKDLRALAEERLRKTRREIAQMPVGDVQKLVQELQVHQVELEMQNEELRRVQGDLEATRDQFAELYDFAPIGYVTLDPAGVVLKANLTAATHLGVSRENLISKKLTSFIAAESQDVFYQHQHHLLTSRNKQTCELQFRRKDGTTFFGFVESIAARGARHIPGQCLVAFADQTARHRAEAALLDTTQFIQQVIASASEGIIVYGTDLKYRVWNPFMERLTGLPAAEVLGKSPLEVFPFLRGSGVLVQLHRALAGAPCHPVEFEYHINPTGRSGWVLDTNSPLRSPKGEIIGVIGIVRDITAHKQEENALRHSENDLTNFFNTAPIGLEWLAADGTILRANQAQLNLLGYSREEYEGRQRNGSAPEPAQLDLLGYSREEYIGHNIVEFHANPAPMRALLKRLAAKETVTNFRSQIRRKDGSLREVLIDANPLWQDNRFVHSSIFTRDITRQVELEREIMAVSEQEQRRIAQDLHDGLGQLLAGTFYLTSNLREKLSAAARPEARPLGRILKLLDEAITQTRGLARGLHPVKPESNGLMVALKELAARTKTLFHISCRFLCPRPVLIENNTIATHLYRIAQEAVTNAIKHGRADHISIGLAETPSRISVAIHDNGAGIRRRRPQRGMGLRIMQHRAGAIGASLLIQKAADGGATVVCSVHKPTNHRTRRPTRKLQNR